MSGISFINAMTIPNTQKKILDNKHFQSCSRQLNTPAEEIDEIKSLLKAEERAWL